CSSSIPPARRPSSSAPTVRVRVRSSKRWCVRCSASTGGNSRTSCGSSTVARGGARRVALRWSSRTPDGARWQLDRNFHDMRVGIHCLDLPGEEWEGEANPAADNEDAREYRRRLQRILGFADIDAYVSTACILQGELRTTRPSDELLRLATGGHRDVQRARERLKAAHRE